MNSTSYPAPHMNSRLARVRTVAASLRPSGPNAIQLAALAFALLLLSYNNIMYANDDWAFPPAWILYPRALLLPAMAVAAAAWVWDVSRRDLGFDVTTWRRSLSAGLGLAALAASPVAAFLVVASFVSDNAFEFSNIDEGTSVGEALYWGLVLYPLHTVIFEEVLFRGVLQAVAVRAFQLVPGILFTAAVFAFWHIATNYQVLGKGGFADNLAIFGLVQLVVLIGLFLGGIILGAIRSWAGNLLTPIAFHWAFLAALGGVLYLVHAT